MATLSELSEQYDKSALMLLERIVELKAQYEDCEISAIERLRLGRRIAILESMYVETKLTAYKLQIYYDE